VANRAPISGVQLLLALLAIGVATAVLPPVAATRLNAYRIAETRDRAAATVRFATSDAGQRLVEATDAKVVCGPGLVPKPAPGVPDEWVRATVIAPALFGPGAPVDAWNQCFLMNIGQAKTGGRVWMLSAGPNGLIETRLGADTVAGDDIGVVVR